FSLVRQLATRLRWQAIVTSDRRLRARSQRRSHRKKFQALVLFSQQPKYAGHPEPGERSHKGRWITLGRWRNPQCLWEVPRLAAATSGWPRLFLYRFSFRRALLRVSHDAL